MTLRTLRYCVPASLLSLACVLGQASIQAQTPPASSVVADTVNGDEIIEGFKLSEVEIDSVLDLMEMLTGRTIIRPAALPTATYSLHLKRPLPRSEAVAALETVLSLNGIGVAPLGDNFLKIIPLAQIRTEAPQLLAVPALSLPPSGRIAAKLFQPDFLRIEDFAQQAQTLVSPGVNGGIVLFSKANAALVTDTISNLQRLETLLNQLDKSAPMPKFYTLKFAKASELVQKIQGILQNPTLQAQLGATPTYSADDRTNQVILVADAQQQSFFDELINRLDVKADPNTRTEVLYLKHATAKDVASLLSSLISGQNAVSQKSGAAQILNNRIDPAAPAAPSANASAAQGNSATFSSIVTVIADERTNSVVANGTMDDLRLIKELVDKVDIILAQVRIEVVIAEVNLTDNNETGIDALQLDVIDNKLVGIAGNTLGLSLAKQTVPGTGLNTNLAVVNRPSPGSYSLSGLIGLTSNTIMNRATILSNPTITTTHNKEAEIFAGETHPSISSYLNEGTSGGSSGYRSTVSNQEIGIRLKVTPLIGDDGSVQLSVEQEVSRVLRSTTIDSNEQPIVGKRTTKSYITAQSGDIIVLGGLQQTTEEKSRSRLGPIPLIGDLLGTRKKSKDRSDLIFFLRPIVLTNTATDNTEVMERVKLLPNNEALQKVLNPGTPSEQKQPSAPVRQHRK